MQSAQAGLAAAEAELTRAQAEEARQSALLKDGFSTKQRYETAVRDLQTAEAQRDSAQAKLTLAREISATRSFIRRSTGSLLRSTPKPARSSPPVSTSCASPNP